MDSSNLKMKEFHGEIPILSLDSGIEGIFYQKCVGNQKWISLLLEWANSKEIYVKHTNLIAGMYGNYSKHDSSHSVAILEGILAVIGKERVEKMSVMDLWLLMHCAYAHDMGMPYSYAEAVELWKTAGRNQEFNTFLKNCQESDDESARLAVDYIMSITEKINPDLSISKNQQNLLDEFSYDWVPKINRYYTYLTAEFCRKNHAFRTRELIEKNIKQKRYMSYFVVEDRFYKFVALCSEAHGRKVEEVLNISREEYAGSFGECHPAFIAVMLRLGDLLDIDNNRFDAILLDYYGDLERISAIHKKKHESITHILYGKNKIEITAESDDEEVCKCACSWFKYLDQEVKNLIFNWADLAPQCLGGCELSVPKTEVYLRGQLFSEKENHEFQINKNMLIELVIGRNLYNSKLDFIREYLQNSFDALKMKFWMELNDDLNSYLIKDSYLDLWKKDKGAHLSPFYFKREAFGRLRTDIKCEWIVVEEQPYIRITLSDRGIGVDEECVQSISHIGSGWKRRKKYKEYLANMPKWLKPTGGFGIGMQSGFMVSDRVIIETKCAEEILGRKITLHSSAKSGKIEECRVEKRHNGTSISVDIPYDWFLDETNFQFYDLYEEREIGDFFAMEEILEAVYKLIVKYVEIVAGNTLLPVYVSRPGFRAKNIQNKLPDEVSEGKTILLDKQTFHVYRREEVVYIWKADEGVLCKIDTSVMLDQANVMWFYKGVRVWTDTRNVHELSAKCFGSISIDIMGVDVEECLTVDRNKFLSEFDYLSLLRSMMRVYLLSVDSIDSLFSVDISDVNSDLYRLRNEDYYKMLYIRYFKDDEPTQKKILAALESLEVYNTELLSNRELLIGTIEFNEEKNAFVSGIKLLPSFCKSFWNNKGGMKTAYYNDSVPLSNVSVSKTLRDEGIEQIVTDKIIYAIICSFERNIRSIKDTSGLVMAYPMTELREESEEKSIVFGSVLDDAGPQKVFRTNCYYPKLYVSSLPFPGKRIYHSEPEKEKKMIISPINKANNSSAVLIRKYKGVDGAEEKFVKSIVEDCSFRYLLEWVYTHQYENGKYTRDEIEEQYIELIKYIYHNEVRSIVEV